MILSSIKFNKDFLANPIFFNSLLVSFDIIFFCLKIFFSITAGSIALLADAFDNFTDIVMALLGLVGLLISKRKPTKKFPYGFNKVENIISLILSIFIFFTAYNIVLQSVQTIFLVVSSPNSAILNVSVDIYIFVVISLVSSIGISLVLNIASKKTNSPILESEAKEKFYDNFISISVLIGFIFAYFNLYIVDPIVSLFIVAFLIKGGYDLFISAAKPLLDAVIDFDERTKLYEMVRRTPKVKDISEILVHSYGRYIFIAIELIVSDNLALSVINKIKKELDQKIRKTFPNVFKVRVSTFSQEGLYERCAIPILENKGFESPLSSHFGESRYFAIVDIKEAQMVDMQILENKYKDEPKRKGILIADWLTSFNIDKLIVKTALKRGPKLIFNNSLVDIILSNKNYINEISQLSRQNNS